MIRLLLAAILGLAMPSSTRIATVQNEAMFGVNLSGAEAGNVPGRIWYDYIYPRNERVDLAYNQGVRLFRLPLRAERVQEGFNGPLRAEVQANIWPLIDYIRSKPGTVVLIDWHDFGRRASVAYGVAPNDAAANIDLITRFMEPYRAADSRVWVSLQNEPHATEAELYWRTAQEVVAGLRERGLQGEIVVNGSGYQAAQSWPKLNGVRARSFQDPLNRTIFEAHTYFDQWGSGTEAACVENGEQRLVPAIRDAEQGGYRLLIGEVAFSDHPSCAPVRAAAIALLKSSPAVVGVAFWSQSDFLLYPKYLFGLTGPDKTAPSPLFTAIVSQWNGGASTAPAGER